MSGSNIMKPWLSAEGADAVAEVIAAGWVVQGPRVAGVRSGDYLVVPSFSFIATADVPDYVVAPVVDGDSLVSTVTAELIGRTLTDEMTAVIIIDQGDGPVDIASDREICASRGIIVIKDAACGSGSTDKGCRFGVAAYIGAWSADPRKLLNTKEVGTLTTRNEERAIRARQLREHPMSVCAKNRAYSLLAPVGEHLEVCCDYRRTDLDAAIGTMQLGRLDEIAARRRETAAIYGQRLSEFPGLRLVRDPASGESNFQSIWVEIKPEFGATREEILGALAGISARRGIMSSRRELVYCGVDTMVASLAVCESLTDNILILPVFHQMSDEEQSLVIGAACGGSGGPGRPMIPVILVAVARLTREVAAAIADNKTRLVIGFLDEGPARPGNSIDGIKVLRAIGDVVEFPIAHPLVCIGNMAARQRIVARLGALRVRPARYSTIVDKPAHVVGSSSVRRRRARVADVVVTASVSVGARVAPVPGVVFTHDEAVDDYATFAAWVAVSANAPVGRAAYRRRNASVRALNAIGGGITIGMAAAVILNIPEAATRLSVPARAIERTG